MWAKLDKQERYLQYLILPVEGSSPLELHLSCREGKEGAVVAEAGAARWRKIFHLTF